MEPQPLSAAPSPDTPPLGYVEIVSPDFVAGWARFHEGVPAHVYALLDGRVAGFAVADEARGDLGQLAETTGLRAGGFLIVFPRAVSAEEHARLLVCVIGVETPLPRAGKLRVDRDPVVQVFVLGSPRSGTSEMGATLTKILGLPWRGEFHAADLFAEAAEVLEGDESSPQDVQRYLASSQTSGEIERLARKAYYSLHGSASFLDKTPGVPMINAAPFLAQCFPSAKFIYLRRNGISNVLSRMVKFGGDFSEHCADWAAALTRWAAVRGALPDYLELRQEDMLHEPAEAARQIAVYLGEPGREQEIAESLGSGRLERTGAGIGRSKLNQTGWTPRQVETFKRLCGQAMAQYGYEM